MSELLRVNNLSVDHLETKAELVRGIDFSLSEGESLTVLGQSGCGKTMTCHAIMGLLSPRRFRVGGDISFDGQNLLTLAGKVRRKIYGGDIAMIPQNPMTAFDPSMKVGKQMLETLALHRDVLPARQKETVERALFAAGLHEPERVYGSYPHALSGGMLQRAMIAMALMVKARLLIADEPTTALDVVNRNATVDAFTALRNRGAAILMVTHDFQVARRIGGDMIVMNAGTIVERGAVESVVRAPKHAYTKALLDACRLSSEARKWEGKRSC